MKTSMPLLMLWALLLPAVTAFQPPIQQALVVVRQAGKVSSMQNTKTALHLSTPSSFFDDVFLLSDVYSDPKATAVTAASAAVGVPDPSPLLNMNVGETLKNVALAITALIFLFVAITALTAAFIIPAGAEQLEIECTALMPEVYEKYKGMLEEGEEMKDRPDLMFELGLLLNKQKADRLKMLCVDAKLGPELWTKYQNMLLDDQELQDRPELILNLGTDLSKRAGQVLKENTSICPESTWEKYEEMAGKEELINEPLLLEELAQELGYPDLVEAVIVCLMYDSNEAPTTAEVEDPREDATTISGITEIRRNTDQWDEDE